MMAASLRRTPGIVFATLRMRVQAEKAYLGNVWFELSSTFLYVVTFLIFVDLLFTRTGPIAGFSESEFLFMTLIGQLSFYVVAQLIVVPMYFLVGAVRKGDFDMLLLKPVPTRTFLYASAVRPLNGLLVSLPNLLLFAAVIDWGGIDVTATSVLGGAIIWVSGLVIFNTLLFLLAYPVFTQGDATDMLNIWYSTISITEIPFRPLPLAMKGLSLVLLPGLLMTAATATVVLQKDPMPLGIITAAVFGAAASLVTLGFLWNRALVNYSSASS